LSFRKNELMREWLPASRSPDPLQSSASCVLASDCRKMRVLEHLWL
jgi:hypothetical protein